MMEESKIFLSDLLKEELIEIRHISPYIDRKKLDEHPHRHPFQEIIYIKSGRGKHTIDGEIFQLEANTIYIIGEGQVHEFLEGKNLKGYLLRYKESFLPSELTKFSTNYALLQMVSDSNSLQLSGNEIYAFESTFSELLSEFKEDEPTQSNQVFHFLLLTLLSRINRKIRNTSEQTMLKSRDNKSFVYSRFMLLVEDHYSSEHNLEFYSQNLNVKPRQLAVITYSKSGLTPKQVINRRLLIEAKRLLRFTNLSFKEISFELGYAQPAYFSRLFKIKTGMSPKTFKESYA